MCCEVVLWGLDACGYSDFCETEGTFFVVIKCFCVRKCLCVNCSFWLYFCIKSNQEKSNMIELHMHHLWPNKNKYSRDQHDELLAPTLPPHPISWSFSSCNISPIHALSLTHIHTHSRVLGCRSCHTLRSRWLADYYYKSLFV